MAVNFEEKEEAARRQIQESAKDLVVARMLDNHAKGDKLRFDILCRDVNRIMLQIGEAAIGQLNGVFILEGMTIKVKDPKSLEAEAFEGSGHE